MSQLLPPLKQATHRGPWYVIIHTRSVAGKIMAKERRSKQTNRMVGCSLFTLILNFLIYPINDNNGNHMMEHCNDWWRVGNGINRIGDGNWRGEMGKKSDDGGGTSPLMRYFKGVVYCEGIWEYKREWMEMASNRGLVEELKRAASFDCFDDCFDMLHACMHADYLEWNQVGDGGNTCKMVSWFQEGLDVMRGSRWGIVRMDVGWGRRQLLGWMW